MSTATAFAARSAPAPRSAPPPFPTRAALALERATWAELDKAFIDAGTPDLDDLVGWEFRGINHLPLNVLPIAQLVGIKKFVKGFYRAEDGRVMGYNRPVGRNALDGRWNIAAKRFGFYEVHEVDPTSRDNTYLHAVLLNYGRGGNKPLDPTSGLRDYLVQLADDIYLGKAFYAVGPLRIPTNFFILERHAVGLTDYERR
jgi:hypothetical protein